MTTPDAICLTPFAVGQVFSTFFLGIFLLQCHTYFVTFKIDRPLYKLVVYFLLMLNILHTALCEAILWRVVVTHLHQKTDWSRPRWLIGCWPPFTGAAACVVQIFYAHRIYRFNQRKPLIPSLITLGSLFQLAWSIAATIIIVQLEDMDKFDLWIHGGACWLGGAAATDLLITSSMVWSFSKARGKVQKTNNLIAQLIALSVGTNMLTFTVNFIDLMLFALHDSPSYVAVNISIVKLYSSSLLFWLNSRPALLENFGGEKALEDQDMSMQAVCKTSARTSLGRHERPGLNLEFGLGACEEGIRVVTTASLRTDSLPPGRALPPRLPLSPREFSPQDPIQRRSDPVENPSLWRSDSRNGFTIQIVGGLELTRTIQHST